MLRIYGRWAAVLLSLALAACGGGGGGAGTQTLSVTVAGSGSVSSSVAGIDCGSDCSEAYASGSAVTLTATPAAGWRFVGWTGGGCGGTSTCTVTLNADLSVQATFSQTTFTLSVNKNGSTGDGSVVSMPAGIVCDAATNDCGEAFAAGTMVTLTAAPDSTSQFNGWSGGGCVGTAQCQVSMTANTTVTAAFAPLASGNRALSVAVAGSGSVASSVGGINCPATSCAASVTQNTAVTLTATPLTGASFVGWSGDCTGTTPTCTLPMTANASVTATFSVAQSTLTVTRAGAGSGTVTSAPAGISCGTTCSAPFPQSASVTLSAAPGSGSLFGGWSGACSGAGACTLSMNAARNVTATFVVARTLTVAKAGTGAGSVTSSPAGIDCGPDCTQDYADGTPVTLTAAPASGSTFAGWSGGGCSGTGSTCTIASLTAATTVTASFSGTSGASVGLDSRPNNTTCFAFDPPTSTTASLTLPRAFTGLSFTQPVAMLQAPGDSTRWFVVEKSGVVRVFANSAGATTASVFIDITSLITTGGELEAGLLGMAFDPNFGVGAGKNQNFYLFYSGAPNSGYRLRSKISRFTANSTATAASATSEVNLLGLDKLDSNHNGGNLAFGPDGYLYAGFGDGGGEPNPQARDDKYLFGKMIRIDPSASTGSVPYAIPADNPNAGQPLCNASGRGGANNCPEVWARGLRNPWRWSFDRSNGRLWIGDVGWGSFEEVNIGVKNADYGWPTAEGYCTANCTGLTDPVYAVPRGDGQSITGGYVYRGTQTTDLQGQYIFGDFGSKMFSAVVSTSTPGTYTVRQLIAPFSSSSVMPSSFGQGNDGELYVLGFDTGFIHKLTFSTGSGGSGPNVPTLLSQTGCAAAGNAQNPSTGMVGYEINAPFWSDNAAKSRYFALPGSSGAYAAGSDGIWTSPVRSVIRKDFRLNGQMIETRLLMRQSNGDWAGYTYEWNTGQTDATLVDAAGKDVLYGTQTWSYPSRTQCLQCHTTAAGFNLGLETQQMNRSTTYAQTGRTANQLTTLSAPVVGMLTPQVSDPNAQPRLSDPLGTDSLGARARAWLHTNCSMCHRPNGPTPVSMNLMASASLAATNTCNVDPSRGTLGLINAKLIAPGLPDSSVILARMNSRDAQVQMPPIGSHLVDTAGVALLRSWISSLTGCN